MKFNSIYDIDLAILEKLNGDISKHYDSQYSICKEILKMLGGDFEKHYSSTFDVNEAILLQYGLEVYPYDSLYNMSKLWLEALGGSADGLYTTYDVRLRILDYIDGPVPPTPTEYKGLTFTALEDGATIKLQNYGTNAPDLKYSTDGENWIQWDYSEITLNEGDKVYFKGNNGTQFSSTHQNYSKFIIPKRISASGNIMSILDDGTLTGDTVGSDCFYQLFYGCTGLITAPELPATVFGGEPYYYLFRNCTNLIKAPETLPCETPSATAYYGMFYGCTSLEVAPVILAKTLKTSTCDRMFYNCTNLNYIKALFTTRPSTINCSNWVSGVSPTGTFVKNGDATWDVRGVNGIPEGWDVITDGVTAEMPATYDEGTGEATIDSEAYDVETGTINLSKLQIMSLELDEEIIEEITE